MPEDDPRCPRSSPALLSRSRQPLGDDRLRRGVDQVVEQGAVARDRDTVEPPLDEEVIPVSYTHLTLPTICSV